MLWQWVAIITRNRSVMYSMLENSSEDVGAQAKSLPDQIKDCLNYAESKGIVVVETLKESHSAKISGHRLIFTKILKDLEVGTIVDMVDNGKIKDLKFSTLEFTNDSSGKLPIKHHVLLCQSNSYWPIRTS